MFMMQHKEKHPTHLQLKSRLFYIHKQKAYIFMTVVTGHLNKNGNFTSYELYELR